MRILLVGLGRMGKRYIQALNRVVPTDLEIVAVDPFSAPEPSAKQHYKDLNSVPAQMFDLAIDAHPNTQRAEILQAFIKMGIKKVICEKPHAQSLEESRRMMEMADASGTEVMLPFFLQCASALNAETIRKLDAGKLCTMNLVSGAVGFGCNGVHHLNFGQQLFNTEPVSVWGDVQLNAIASPRGEQFRDHGGIIVVNYPTGSMVLNIQSESSAGIQTTLLFENGKIQYSESNDFKWEWWRRRKEDDKLPSFRTHMEQSVTPPTPYNLDMIEIMSTGIGSFLKGKPISNLRDGHRVLKMIALGIASSKLQKRVQWSDEQLAADITFSFT